jgi:hypothetical protein
MAENEKVIHEVRIIETEDGFRIEIKGDKERLREMGIGKGMFSGFGFGGGPFRHGPFGHGPFRHGPFGRGPRGFGFPFGPHHGPWGYEEEEKRDEGPMSRA